MKKVITILFIFVCSFVGITQNNGHLIDSLKFEISNSKSDIKSEALYRSLCETYSFTNPDSAIYYGLKSIKLHQENPELKNIEYLYYVMGESYLDLDLETSKKYFEKSIQKSIQVKNDSVEHLAYFGLSSYYSNFAKVDSTLYYNTKSKNYFESKKDTNALINCYYNMMSIYSMTHDFENVLEYGLLCESLFTKENNHFLKGDIYVGLSFVYDRKGINKDMKKHNII